MNDQGMMGQIRMRDVQAARALLDSANHVTIVSHVRPDGDAVGSMLGLMHSLRARGADVDVVLQDGVPHRFRFLPGADEVRTSLPSRNGLLIAVDSADLERVGLDLEGDPEPPDLNIDHHATNTHFARVNLVDPEASSAAEYLFKIAPELGLPMNVDTASCWLLAMITDTLGFRTSSVKPETLHIAAALMEQGAHMPELYLRGLHEHRYLDLLYWARGLLGLSRRGPMVWTTLSLEDREAVSYDSNDDADLINLLSAIEGVTVSIIFVQQDEGSVKVSWRSHEGCDVSRIATAFGGGGHAQAAGAVIAGTIDEVVERVVGETESVLIPRTE